MALGAEGTFVDEKLGADHIFRISVIAYHLNQHYISKVWIVIPKY